METGREIMHYALGDNQDYEHEWSKAVLEYLEKGYSSEDNRSEITVGNTIYKTLKREKVTAFYDADGNTLFDIENERLKEEYEAMEEPAGAEEAEGDEPSDDSCTQNIEEAHDTETQEVSEKGGEEEKADTEPTAKGIDGAVAKLQGELKKAKEGYAEPILSHMIDRCNESETLADAVCQTHKTWGKCFKYIMDQARKLKSGNCAMVKDSVVYEWAEDYYRLDDKALEEKKAKEAAGKKKKQEEKRKADKEKKENDKPAESQAKKLETPKTEQKPKKSNKDMDGQLDMFSLMGI